MHCKAYRAFFTGSDNSLGKISNQERIFVNKNGSCEKLSPLTLGSQISLGIVCQRTISFAISLKLKNYLPY